LSISVYQFRFSIRSIFRRAGKRKAESAVCPLMARVVVSPAITV
jgi:hypothetical protein